MVMTIACMDICLLVHNMKTVCLHHYGQFWSAILCSGPLYLSMVASLYTMPAYGQCFQTLAAA